MRVVVKPGVGFPPASLEGAVIEHGLAVTTRPAKHREGVVWQVSTLVEGSGSELDDWEVLDEFGDPELAFNFWIRVGSARQRRNDDHP